MKENPIWLFDGHCLFCCGSVQYVLAHEKHERMRFVAVQSAEGRRLALQHGINPDDPVSFLFVDNGKALFASDGVLALLRHVRGPARLLLIGHIVPKALRDGLYRWFARNRYRFFGRTRRCRIPDPATRHRFILPFVNGE